MLGDLLMKTNFTNSIHCGIIVWVIGNTQKRYFISIEKNKEYFNNSIERLNKYELKINIYVHE